MSMYKDLLETAKDVDFSGLMSEITPMMFLSFGLFTSHVYRADILKKAKTDGMSANAIFFLVLLAVAVRSAKRIKAQLEDKTFWDKFSGKSWAAEAKAFVMKRLVQYTKDIRKNPEKVAVVHVVSSFPSLSALAWIMITPSDGINVDSFMENTWAAQMDVNEKLLEIQKEWEKKFWTETVKKGGDDYIAGFNTNFWETKAKDMYPFLYEDMSASKGPLNYVDLNSYLNRMKELKATLQGVKASPSAVPKEEKKAAIEKAKIEAKAEASQMEGLMRVLKEDFKLNMEELEREINVTMEDMKEEKEWEGVDENNMMEFAVVKVASQKMDEKGETFTEDQLSVFSEDQKELVKKFEDYNKEVRKKVLESKELEKELDQVAEQAENLRNVLENMIMENTYLLDEDINKYLCYDDLSIEERQAVKKDSLVARVQERYKESHKTTTKVNTIEFMGSLKKDIDKYKEEMVILEGLDKKAAILRVKINDLLSYSFSK